MHEGTTASHVSDANPTTSSPGMSAERLVWVDVAKAIAIVLVVVHHSVIFADAAGWLPPAVTVVNQQLATFRMPLFFLASGLFAASALARPWSQVWRRRLAFYAYLYVLWVVIRFTFFLAVPDVRGATDGDGLRELAVSMVLPDTGMWFLYALAVFAIVAKVMRPIPVAIQLLAAAVLAAATAAGWVPVYNLAWRSMCLYLIFFLLGMHASGGIRHMASHATLMRAAAWGAGALVVVAMTYRLGAGGIPGVMLVTSLVAVAFGVCFAAVLARTPAAQPLARLGSLTLPVYLIHVMVVAGAVAAVDAVTPLPRTLGVAAMPALVALGLFVSLALYRFLSPRLPALFALPKRPVRPRQAARVPQT